MVPWATAKKLGINQKTIDEEDIVLMQFGGLYPMTKFYASILFSTYGLACLSLPIVVYKFYEQNEPTFAFDSAHLVLIYINMLVQCFFHHYYSDIPTKMYKAIDNGFVSYGDTMDEKSKEYIKQMADEKDERKRIKGLIFRGVCIAAGGGVLIKRPLLYILNGHGKRDVDGLDWLLYESPTGLYLPYSNYWIPYIFGMLLSHAVVFFASTTVWATVTSMTRFSEELLHQLFIVKLGLNNATGRAQHLYRLKFGDNLPTDGGDTKFKTCLQECLISSVKHHHVIIDLFDDYKKMMYYPLFTVIFDGGALICLATVILMNDQSIAARMSIPPIIVGELYYTYVYCDYGERLSQAFSEVGDELYTDDFLPYSRLMKPYLNIINAYSLKPKQLSAAGFTSPNLEGFGNVLRTAYSLLNFMVARN